MLTEEHKKKLESIARFYGEENQLMILAEECSELAQASLKAIRDCYDFGSKLRIIGEMADVRVMMAQIQFLLNIQDTEVEQVMEEKINRQLERIGTERTRKEDRNE